jgi:hypothetical protein
MDGNRPARLTADPWKPHDTSVTSFSRCGFRRGLVICRGWSGGAARRHQRQPLRRSDLAAVGARQIEGAAARQARPFACAPRQARANETSCSCQGRRIEGTPGQAAFGGQTVEHHPASGKNPLIHGDFLVIDGISAPHRASHGPDALIVIDAGAALPESGAAANA